MNHGTGINLSYGDHEGFIGVDEDVTGIEVEIHGTEETMERTKVLVYGPNGYFELTLPGVTGDPFEDIKKFKITYINDKDAT